MTIPSYHTFSSCFERLGISSSSTEREIKKTYRRLALETHPDKVPVEQKDQASQAFRDLYEAYEEALERCSSRPPSEHKEDNHDSSFSSPRPRKNKPTDSEIKKAFNDVCDDLSRELAERLEAAWQVCVRKVQAAWPNEEECWKEADAVLKMDIERLAQEVEDSNPNLAAFLVERKAEWRREFDAEEERKLRLRVDRVNRDWPERKDELHQWVMSGELLSWTWEETTEQVESMEAARAIRLWNQERLDKIKKRIAENRKDSAKRIVEVFPDRKAIRSILARHCIWERREIYDLLPDDIRTALLTSSEVD